MFLKQYIYNTTKREHIIEEGLKMFERYQLHRISATNDLYGRNPNCVESCCTCKVDDIAGNWITDNQGRPIDRVSDIQQKLFSHYCCTTDCWEHVDNKKGQLAGEILSFGRKTPNNQFSHRKGHNPLNLYLFMLSNMFLKHIKNKNMRNNFTDFLD